MVSCLLFNNWEINLGKKDEEELKAQSGKRKADSLFSTRYHTAFSVRSAVIGSRWRSCCSSGFFPVSPPEIADSVKLFTVADTGTRTVLPHACTREIVVRVTIKECKK